MIDVNIYITCDWSEENQIENELGVYIFKGIIYDEITSKYYSTCKQTSTETCFLAYKMALLILLRWQPLQYRRKLKIENTGPLCCLLFE